MKTSFRMKLMLSYLCLVLLIGVVVYGYLNHATGKYMVAEITDNLVNETRLAALLANRTGADLQQDAPVIATAVGKEIDARITIVDTQGRVVGDSEVPKSQLESLENHLNRPEVAEATSRGTGTAIRYSSTLRVPMLYVARAITLQSGEKGIIRLAVPLAQLEKAKARMHALLGIALLLALVAAGFFSAFLSSFISRSLRAIAATASRIGRGEHGLLMPVESRDEVGALATVMNEMSVRIEAQMHSLEAERNQLDAILHGMGEGLLVTDAHGRITLVNATFKDLFDLHDDLTGKLLIEVSRHPDLQDVYKKVIAGGSECQKELTLTEPEQTILTHWVPLVDGSKVYGVVAVFHDISDMKRLAASRRDFVANVSHELRTPVAVIQGYAETLLSGAPHSEADSRRFLQVIYNHSERLSALISDLLVLSELESGMVRLDCHPVQLEEVVEHVVVLLSQRAAQKEIAVSADYCKDGKTVSADKAKLEQILINLLDNAIKYSPDHGLITIATAAAGPMVKVSITDTGLGIPAKDLQRVFERFYRVDEARSREQGGTGLGLSIVKHLVQVHGGSITVESLLGKGSTFIFTLRKADAGDDAPAGYANTPEDFTTSASMK